MATTNTAPELRTVTKAKNSELQECAGLLQNYASWHQALFSAIHRMADIGPDALGLKAGDHVTIRELARIGEHLADEAGGMAIDYLQKAK